MLDKVPVCDQCLVYSNEGGIYKVLDTPPSGWYYLVLQVQYPSNDEGKILVATRREHMG
jgi:hypothetical protein